MQEEEVGPLRYGEKTVLGVEAFFGKGRFGHACQFGEDPATLLSDIREQLVEGFLQIRREERVLFRYISVEGGRLFCLQAAEQARALAYLGNDPARLKGLAWLLFNLDEFVYVR